MLTQRLTGPHGLAVIGLELALPIVVELGKRIRRRHRPLGDTLDVQRAVTPTRAASILHA
jgi:hypothetical protein